MFKRVQMHSPAGLFKDFWDVHVLYTCINVCFSAYVHVYIYIYTMYIYILW